MENRNQYTEIEDFLADPSFQLWVRSKVDQQDWEDWTLGNSKMAKVVEEARLFLLAMKIPENNLSTEEIKSALESTWIKIEEKEKAQNKNVKLVKIWKNTWYRSIAAVFLFGLSFTWVYNNYFISESGIINYHDLIKENELVEQINNTSKPQITTLSDGSSVLLNPNSKLSYPKVFAKNERKVYLSGEGFFEISKNAKRPFYVYANEIVTKVVGTSFRIKAYANEPDIEVLVLTGNVKVNSNQKIKTANEKEVSLLPNQALRFERKNFTFNKITDITQDRALAKTLCSTIEKINFEFTDVPVDQIFKTIEQAYLVEIDYPREKLKDCHLTTSLIDQPLPEKLKIICKSLGNNSNYIMNGNQIIILSNGCN
ncbi:FecR family protein [Flavobacterium cellulosilyticum]|uniref:FecR family protein n=1 Tax=Flavobacterium cellulosilyticum TaxID=2541731 RepID=A0A4R5C6L9_9FLAO|nr:FecR family protein [Flavobacterium cellulosilyticum]TDD94705.1 FecR family protein [Flavobacterium cellulosilyticum]